MTVKISLPTTCISFIRHGQVDNPDNIFYGRLTGFKLNSHGYEESARVSEILKNCPISCLYSSPMLRARQTAKEILRHHPHLKLNISSLITEISSAFQGESNAALANYKWDVYANKDPKYEQPEDVLRRTLKFIHRIRIRHYGHQVVAITHGDVILFAMFHSKKIPATAANKLNLNALGILNEYPATGSIITLTFKTTNMGEIPDMSYFIP